MTQEEVEACVIAAIDTLNRKPCGIRALKNIETLLEDRSILRDLTSEERMGIVALVTVALQIANNSQYQFILSRLYEQKRQGW